MNPQLSRSILVHENPIEALVEFVVREAREAIEARGSFSWALPGGSVATEGFPRLAVAPIRWPRVDFFWGDERGVPPTHPDSNYAVAEVLLLSKISADPKRIHRMPAEQGDLVAAAREYEGVVRRVGIDLAVLGVGPDGHVCSLFPGHPLLERTERWVLPIEDSPKPPPRRLTLTLPALFAARSVVIVAMGTGKASVVREAVEDGASALPLARVLRGVQKVALLADRAAAGGSAQLPSTGSGSVA